MADRAFVLNRECDHSPSIGFGWTTRPEEVFDRPDLHKSRTALTIDGVSGLRLAFQADVSPGKWHVLLWLETGDTDRQWPQLLIQGRRQALNWQSFPPPEEPHLTAPKQFRVFQCTTTVNTAGLRIELAATAEKVRLLGISLIRQARPTRQEHQTFLRKWRQSVITEEVNH